MRTDRYLKTVLTVIAVALTALALQAWLPSLVPARVEAQTSAAKYDIAVPKAWGKITAFSNNNVLMEASDGTYRVVDLEGKAPEYPKVKVQFRLQ